MKDRVLFVAFLSFSRIEKVCESTAQALSYEQELIDQGLNPVRTEIYPESFIGVRIDNDSQPTSEVITVLH